MRFFVFNSTDFFTNVWKKTHPCKSHKVSFTGFNNVKRFLGDH